MGAMKEIFTEIQSHLVNHEWAELATYLRGEFEPEEAKTFLVGAVELMGENQKPVSYDTPEIVPARYLEHLTESNWHALHTLIEYEQGKITGYTDATLERAYRNLVNTLREGDK